MINVDLWIISIEQIESEEPPIIIENSSKENPRKNI